MNNRIAKALLDACFITALMIIGIVAAVYTLVIIGLFITLMVSHSMFWLIPITFFAVLAVALYVHL